MSYSIIKIIIIYLCLEVSGAIAEVESGLRQTFKQCDRVAYCLKDYRGEVLGNTKLHVHNIHVFPADRAVRIAADFVCPGFPAHALKVQDDRMLYHLRSMIGKTPIIIYSDIKMTPEWEAMVQALPPVQTMLAHVAATPIDMVAYTIAMGAENRSDLASCAMSECTNSPHVGAQLYKRGKHAYMPFCLGKVAPLNTHKQTWPSINSLGPPRSSQDGRWSAWSCSDMFPPAEPLRPSSKQDILDILASLTDRMGPVPLPLNIRGEVAVPYLPKQKVMVCLYLKMNGAMRRSGRHHTWHVCCSITC